MADAPEIFRCVPLLASLSRSSCGARSREVATPGNQRGIKLVSGTCEECVVGRAHAAGERPTTWPDGSPIVLLRLARSTEPASMPLQVSKPARPVPVATWAGVGRSYRGEVISSPALPPAQDPRTRTPAKGGETPDEPAGNRPGASGGVTPDRADRPRKRGSAADGTGDVASGLKTAPSQHGDSRERPAPITAAGTAQEPVVPPKRRRRSVLRIEWKGRVELADVWSAELGVSTREVCRRWARGCNPDGSPCPNATFEAIE